MISGSFILRCILIYIAKTQRDHYSCVAFPTKCSVFVIDCDMIMRFGTRYYLKLISLLEKVNYAYSENVDGAFS